jgi:CHAD domain-containing protein
MGQLLETAEANLPGVRGDVDTEFLHDLRVAVRRGRSVLKLVGGAFPARDAEVGRVELKWLGDLTTPTRDLDVYLLGLDDLAAEVTATSWNPAHLDPFRGFLAAKRAKEQRALVRGLASAHGARAFAAWARLGVVEPTVGDAPHTTVPDADEPASDRLAGEPVGGVARRCIARAFSRVVDSGARIGPASPASDLHDLRKRCKELRYALEVFASLHAPAAQRILVGDLKVLQDCLGEFQDTEVQQHAIRHYAEEMLAAGVGSAETVMAMGRLADRLEERQVQARARFATLFTDFASKRTRSHLLALRRVTP